MIGTYNLDEVVAKFRAEGRIAIVGASLAGLRAAEALRERGFDGSLTIIGDEPHEPYDRPPLSKQVLKGWVPADHTKLPRLRRVDADWKLGVAAVGLDRPNHVVTLANGEDVGYDRLLIATGTRARPWPNPAEGALQGVFTVRTVEDAAGLAAALRSRPKRVLVVGSGFVGSEIASVCRDLDLPVTVAERGKGPLRGALGGVISDIAAGMMRDAGVDLRTGVAVEDLSGDSTGHVRSAHLSDGTDLDVDVVVASLGSIRNVEWLDGAGLAAGQWGVACDAGCRAFDINGVVTDHIFVAGDVARAPHVLYGYEFLSQEHWDNAVFGAEVAANNMIHLEVGRRPHLPLPSFWSGQFGVNIKSVGVCSFGDEIVFTQGSPADRRFAAAYGKRGRIVGAVTFNHGKWLPYYASLIEKSAPFPPPPPGYDRPADAEPMPARFPDPREPAGNPDVVLTGHDPTDRSAQFRPRA
ncbi:FAD-dependent oxidoreductase [Mycobacterium crocinum]|uniref:FAD-dependent oxidoreductase n=1 Tax=Mycolicibacterium crocinum TaxID=388459 RepID=A0ABY3TNQ8_9MYCO|nr:FAD-dependent oxidoreductase [Mycolicibacterium crocinum]MCV7215595.1 FAD-dependent oxidoreductase [Mycolicibacterium crocinum]ULN43021.1 FAD-dependent oxidoreductase [Mycolicibacterium crocinum]